jgi:thioredoxin reductase (NADPH)
MYTTSINIFPRLNQSQITYLKGFGNIVPFNKGDVIINLGERNYDLYVVLDGKIIILDPYDGNKLITCHEKGEFTGDSDILSDRAAMFRAVAKTDGEALCIPHSKLKKILDENSELNDLFVKVFIMRRADVIKNHAGGYTLVGSKFSKATYYIREFFSKNHIRFTWLDLERDKESNAILERLNISHEDTPIVIDPDANVYRNPSLEEIAKITGLSALELKDRYDVLIVGAGPAGLASSVYGSSEGLSVITIDQIGPGGQAGNSALIENYLGFPTGLSGAELANRAYLQAQKFGCTISVPFKAKKLYYKENYFELELSNGKTIKASSVIGATGAHYRNLNVPGIEKFNGKGIYYGATPNEAKNCKNEEVVVIGGGNSAGQAAIFLSTCASKVHLVIRGDSLEKSMSSYLINRIENNNKITLHIHEELIEVHGDNKIECIEFRNNKTNDTHELNVSHLFLFIGAEPANEWLSHLVCADDKGFILTGNDLNQSHLQDWNLNRMPFPLETCIPGLFVVGDLRSGSTKRVASAVGEGSMAISYVHQILL